MPAGAAEEGRNKQISCGSLEERKSKGADTAGDSRGHSGLLPPCLCFPVSYPGPKPWLRSWVSLSLAPLLPPSVRCPRATVFLICALLSIPAAATGAITWPLSTLLLCLLQTTRLQQLEGITSMPASYQLSLAQSVLSAESPSRPPHPLSPLLG